MGTNDVLRIDFTATKQRFVATGRKFKTYARVNGLKEASFYEKICGRAPLNAAEIALLERDNLLVWMKKESSAPKTESKKHIRRAA